MGFNSGFKGLIDKATCPCSKEAQTVDYLIYRCTLLHTNRELLKSKRPTIRELASKQAGTDKTPKVFPHLHKIHKFR